MNLKEAILNTITVIAATCAVVVTVRVVSRGDASSSGTEAGSLTLPPIKTSNWQKLVESGHRIGPAAATLTIVEFGDFECPACAAYEHVLDTVRMRYPQDFAVMFHHFPLTYHHLAYPLARASECAAAQGRFVAFHDSVYARHTSLGVIPVNQFGLLAGVPDTVRFAQCVSDTARVPVIDADIAEAKRIGVPGTPGIIVDGMLYRSDFPSAKDLEALIKKRVGAHQEDGSGGA